MNTASPTTTEAVDVNMVVASNVRAEFSRTRWSGRKAAAALGLSPMYVNRRLAGETPLDPSDLVMFAELIGVPVAKFFADTTKPLTETDEGRAARLEGLEPPTFCTGVYDQHADVVSIDDFRARMRNSAESAPEFDTPSACVVI
jgi:transcriptional regulator with XRE-family HTH domain